MILCGINHKTAPIEIREKFHLNLNERTLLLNEFKNDPRIIEAIVLSTCNRTEICAHLIDENVGILLDHLCRIKKISMGTDVQKYFYSYQGKEALEHFLRVSTGADSLILGEKQVLGQIKEAVELSRAKAMLQKEFNVLSQIVIRAGKKAQSETAIGCGGSSVSWAAVTMAQHLLGTLQDKSVLIIGAGKMGHLAVSHLKEKGASKIYVMSRTHENSCAVANEFGAEAVSFLELKNILAKVDVCICSASAPQYLLEKDLIDQIMPARAKQKLVLIDISMPRNIHPDIAFIENVSLLSVDDLDKAVEHNIARRRLAVEEVEKIIAKKIDEFYAKIEKIRVAEASKLNPSEKSYVAR
ncbi:MAG: glutamyl-tRNA reductase [Candidatus Omnitrophota bacterium]